jgi:hypothetical protein
VSVRGGGDLLPLRQCVDVVADAIQIRAATFVRRYLSFLADLIERQVVLGASEPPCLTKHDRPQPGVEVAPGATKRAPASNRRHERRLHRISPRIAVMRERGSDLQKRFEP